MKTENELIFDYSKKYWTNIESERNSNRSCFCDFNSKNKNCRKYWKCPKCAKINMIESYYKIQSYFKELIKTNSLKKYKTIYLTLTFSHNKKENLKDLIELLNSNFRKLQGNRFYRKASQDNHILKLFKSLEITYSKKNGWHPHINCVFILSENLNANNFIDNIIEKWCKYFKNTFKKYQYFTEITNFDDLESEWNFIKELTHGYFKIPTELSPYLILKKLALNKHEDYTREKLIKLYLEYINATYKKTQIFTSL